MRPVPEGFDELEPAFGKFGLSAPAPAANGLMPCPPLLPLESALQPARQASKHARIRFDENRVGMAMGVVSLDLDKEFPGALKQAQCSDVELRTRVRARTKPGTLRQLTRSVCRSGRRCSRDSARGRASTCFAERA